MMFQLRLCQRLFLLLFLLCIFIIFLKVWYLPLLEDSSSKSLVVTNNNIAKNIINKDTATKGAIDVYQAPKFSQFSSCPACFGYKMCREIDMGSLIFHGEMPNAKNNRILWKKAVLKNERVLISSPSMEEWNKFDEFLCLNSSQMFPCDISISIRKTFLTSDQILLVEKIRNLYQLVDSSYVKVVLPICASRRLLEELQKTFDDDFDGYLSKEEQSMLFTSLLMQPGYVVMKLQSKSGMNMPIPNVLGACGRTVVLEGGLTPLKEFVRESFDVRAGLAVQVLQIVEDFEDEDPQWYFMYTDFSLDSLVVTKDGEVIVMDLEELAILDKSLFPPGYMKMQHDDELCNEVCFQKATEDMLYSSNSSVCSRVPQYSQLMYAIICKQVLSDLKEHKTEGFFNFDGHKVHKESKSLGLLHSIPISDKERIEDLLRECVQETRHSGRMKAVDELREILENHVNPNEIGESSSHINKLSSHSLKKVSENYNNYANEEEGNEYIDGEADDS